MSGRGDHSTLSTTNLHDIDGCSYVSRKVIKYPYYSVRRRTGGGRLFSFFLKQLEGGGEDLDLTAREMRVRRMRFMYQKRTNRQRTVYTVQHGSVHTSSTPRSYVRTDKPSIKRLTAKAKAPTPLTHFYQSSIDLTITTNHRSPIIDHRLTPQYVTGRGAGGKKFATDDVGGFKGCSQALCAIGRCAATRFEKTIEMSTTIRA